MESVEGLLENIICNLISRDGKCFVKIVWFNDFHKEVAQLPWLCNSNYILLLFHHGVGYTETAKVAIIFALT